MVGWLVLFLKRKKPLQPHSAEAWYYYAMVDDYAVQPSEIHQITSQTKEENHNNNSKSEKYE
jgi:hypothetical protein